MSTHQARLAELVQSDPRFPYEAYEFVFAALTHTQRCLGRVSEGEPSGEPEPEHHITGRELVEGIRELAVREFGLMARIVFRLWGINRTGDFGEIVFNLVAANLMSKNESDSKEDFRDIFDLDQALVQDFRIQPDEAEWSR